VIAEDLTQLDLSNLKALTNPILKCDRLNALNLADCVSLTDAALQRISVTCPRLQLVKLSGCSSLVRPEMVFEEGHLEEIDFSNCRSIKSLKVQSEALRLVNVT
jgi:hypothetical protein